MTFQIGEKVVYPNQGVGTIENISSRSFGTVSERFYLLRFGFNSMTVMVPFSNVGNVGLRPVTKDREVARILSFLAHGACRSSADWKVRYKENLDKMQSGSLYKVAEVLKALLLVQTEKQLSFREKKMLERARHMLMSEVAIARGIAEAQAEGLLERALAKCCLPLPRPS
jgi:CarD family transcriptional regulator, regulator of rRNA transcription